MDIQKEKRSGVTVVAPRGRIDSVTSSALEQALVQSLDAGERRLVVDLTGVDFISSAGLRVLLVLAKRLGGGKGSVVLCSLSDPVRQVFELAGFLSLFTISPSRDLALEKANATA